VEKLPSFNLPDANAMFNSAVLKEMEGRLEGNLVEKGKDLHEFSVCMFCAVFWNRNTCMYKM